MTLNLLSEDPSNQQSGGHGQIASILYLYQLIVHVCSNFMTACAFLKLLKNLRVLILDCVFNVIYISSYNIVS